MNTSHYLGKASRTRRGIALVSVLVLVVLLTAVIISFWATSTLEYTASRSYKATSSARMMADVAVNLAQGQINEATSQGINYAWASQPGAIRVYDNTGAVAKIYRLYSASSLTTTTATVANPASTMNIATTTAGTNDMPPTAWAASPALWVDLNAPANDASGTAHFPIFNESKAVNVDGFSIGPTTASPSITAPPGATASQPAPMPVRWLYVLQNGQIIAPDAGSTNANVTFVNALVQPGVKNPIVGRIAFWTDDETCKVNINTAGGSGVGAVAGATSPPTIDPTLIANATFWDLPHFTAPDDYNSLAQSQPATGEFQRYPGHPATVALQNVLSGLGFPALATANFYSLTPRYSNGGSLGGTAIDAYIGNNAAIALKGAPQNHLYTSVAEMLFTNGRGASTINNSSANTQPEIETARFFLTAHSRAPELTLFGQPRVSMWPEIDPNDTMSPKRPRSAIDKLIAFCSTNSGNAYYFTRYDPTSCSVDINLPRNVTLLQYLDYFTSQPTPGYGPAMATYTSPVPLSFDNKYTQLGMRQILTEIFDYIRTTNIADSTMASPVTQDYAQGWTPSFGYLPGLFQVAPSLGNAPLLNGTPSALGWNTQGFGIYPRLSEVAVQFTAMGQGASQPIPNPPLTTALPALTGVPMNSIYTTPTVNKIGVSGPEIFGVGDSCTNPFRSNDPTMCDAPANPANPATPPNPNLNSTYPTPGTVDPYPNPTSTVNPLANPYMTDAAWEAAGWGNSQTTGLPTSTTILEVQANVNSMVQDTRPYFVPTSLTTGTYPNPNYGKWFAPGNTHPVIPPYTPPALPPTALPAITGRTLQAFLLLNFTNPAQMIVNDGTNNGWVRPLVWVRVQGLDSLRVNGHALGFSGDATMLFHGLQDDSSWGTISFEDALAGRHTGTTPPSSGDNWQSIYPLYSKIIPVQLNWPTDTWPPQPNLNYPGINQINFTGGQLTITLYDGGGLGSNYFNFSSVPPSTAGSNGLQVVQTYKVSFGNNGASIFAMPTYPPQIPDPYTMYYPSTTGPNPNNTAANNPSFAAHPNENEIYPDTWPSSLDPNNPLPTQIPTNGSGAIISMLQSVGIKQTSTPVPFYTCTSGNPIPYFSPPAITTYTPGTNTGDRWNSSYLGSTSYPWGNGVPGYVLLWTNEVGWDFVEIGDVVQSMVLGDSSNISNPGPWSDARMLATGNVPTTAFTTNPLWGNLSRPLAHNLTWNDCPWFSTNPSNPATYPNLGQANKLATYWSPSTINLQGYGSLPDFPPTLSAGIPNLTSGNANTDWDSGIGFNSDGPWINKADEGSLAPATTPPAAPGPASVAYNVPWSAAASGPAFYSANREVPSPGMLGSLSTGVDPTGANPTGWQTLLFRPYPNTTDIPGNQSPMDHLLLDLFWMPVAEPYAISEPFSTGGKINLNYQIEPFTYITRSTAIRAVLNTQKVAQVSATGTQGGNPNGEIYKQWKSAAGGGHGLGLNTNTRFPLDVNMTLTQFDDKFNGTNTSGVNVTATPDIFHSASQICEMYLVPKLTSNPETSVSGFAANWYNGDKYGLIGDNVRERPYTNVYGVLTTKSNTFTVYYRVQSLKNAEPATAAGQAMWNENQGTVLGEYRGSTILERYIDPNQTIPDFAAAGAAADTGGSAPQATLDGGGGYPSYYRWRIVDNHQFAP